MIANEKYLKLTAPSGRRFFLRASQVISVQVLSATKVSVVYAQAEQGSQGWNISLTTAADANEAAADLMAQIINFQAAPYTDRVRDFSENGYKITGQ
tara:strand:- start:251 stop:541 length:291 start_codon:yes stop_codon:yes gene_type:complete